MTENHIGKTLYVADALPATNDAAGFEALNWTKVNGLQQAPQLGITHAGIEVPDLESGFTRNLKGAGQGVSSQMQFRDVPDDTGQEMLETQANDGQGLLSVKLVKGSGADNAPQAGDPVQYAQGNVGSYQPIQPNVTNHQGFEVTFQQNDFTVKADEPA